MQILQVNSCVSIQSLVDDAQISGTCSLPACLKKLQLLHQKEQEGYRSLYEEARSWHIGEDVQLLYRQNINHCVG